MNHQIEDLADSTLLWGGGLEMDSIDFIEAVMIIEAEFDVFITDDDSGTWLTVGDMVAYLERRLAGTRGIS